MSVPESRLARTAAAVSAAVLLLTATATAGTASAAPAPTPSNKVPAAPTVPVTGTGAPVGRNTPGADADDANCVVEGLGRGDSLVREDRGKPSDPTARCDLLSVGIPTGHTDVYLSGYGTYLELQNDGNLVEYETSTDAVLFTTNTRTGAKLTYQQDGNVVLYDAAGKALWSLGTSGETTGTFFGPYGNGQLILQSSSGNLVKVTGKAVTAGPGVVNYAAASPNSKYRLRVQSDGNVVAYNLKTGKAFWSTGTSGKGKVRLATQADGNMVLYAYPSNKVLWQTRTTDKRYLAYYQLDMQDDGNVVLYRTDGSSRVAAVWSSHTHGS